MNVTRATRSAIILLLAIVFIFITTSIVLYSIDIFSYFKLRHAYSTMSSYRGTVSDLRKKYPQYTFDEVDRSLLPSGFRSDESQNMDNKVYEIRIMSSCFHLVADKFDNVLHVLPTHE